MTSGLCRRGGGQLNAHRLFNSITATRLPSPCGPLHLDRRSPVLTQSPPHTPGASPAPGARFSSHLSFLGHIASTFCTGHPQAEKTLDEQNQLDYNYLKQGSLEKLE